MFGVIYSARNLITGLRYIGQTTELLNKRWLRHCWDSRRDRFSYLHQAIKKYGKENFEIKVLARCDSLEEMNHREAYYIKLFNTLRPNGYNLMSGGGNSKHSEETKRKIAKANIGKKRPEELKQKLRKPKSEAHKLKISAKLKGRKVPELVLQKRSYTKRQKLKLQIYDIK